MEELRKNVGLVFQTPAPFPFSIYKNLTYAPVYYGIRDKKAGKDCRRDTKADWSLRRSGRRIA